MSTTEIYAVRHEEEACTKCGYVGCDGLANCKQCGEDCNCGDDLCINCERQKAIDDDPNSGGVP